MNILQESLTYLVMHWDSIHGTNMQSIQEIMTRFLGTNSTIKLSFSSYFVCDLNMYQCGRSINTCNVHRSAYLNISPENNYQKLFRQMPKV